MTDVRKKLAAELLPTGWDMLLLPHRRGALFLVDEKLALLDVAVAVALDDKRSVEGWIADGSVARPSAEQASEWQQERGLRFTSVIVQPFVLAQRIALDRGPASPLAEA